MRSLQSVFILATITLVCLLAAGCGRNPRIDSSSDEAFKKSIQAAKDALPESQRQEFEGAVMVVAMEGTNLLALAAAPGGAERQMKDRLNGKTGPEILALASKIRAEAAEKEKAAKAEQESKLRELRAKQVAQMEKEIAELEAEKVRAAEAIEKLALFKIDRSLFYFSKDGFMSEPTIELTVTNGTGQAVARAYFRGVLATPGRSVPWVDDTFNYQISGGLEPGESATWKLRPNMFDGWGSAPRDRQDMVMTVTVVKLDGANGEAFLHSAFSKNQEDRLAKLKTSVEKLKNGEVNPW